MSRASEILAGDPAMAIKAHQAALEDAPPPADRGPYPHGLECPYPNAEVAWELLDPDVGLWKRQHFERGCGLVQYSVPDTPPSPPRPDEAALVGWSHAFDGKPCVNVEPAIKIELVPFEDESQRKRGLQYWRGECRVCKSVKRWVSEAAAHYREHDVELTADRPRTFSMDDLGPGRPDPFREGLRR